MQQATTAAAQPELGDPARRARIEALLRLYPQTSEAENSEILRFLSTGAHIDIGLVAGSEEFAPKVAEFRKRYKSHFGMKLRDGAWFFGLTLGPAALYLFGYLLK